MEQFGRVIITVGAVLVAVGVVLWSLGRAGFRGLPGDVFYKSDRVSFYFPVVTCIVLSLVLTAVVWVWRWLNRG